MSFYKFLLLLLELPDCLVNFNLFFVKWGLFLDTFVQEFSEIICVVNSVNQNGKQSHFLRELQLLAVARWS